MVILDKKLIHLMDNNIRIVVMKVRVYIIVPLTEIIILFQS